MNNIVKKISVAVLGLFVMAIGVALSVKARLGVSPISCIPYVYSLKLDFSLGELTILMNSLFVLTQFLILRRRYTLLHLSQLLAVTVFGFLIDISMYIMSDIVPNHYLEQLLMCLMSCVVIAFGVFLLVKANVTYLPGDGLAVVIADVFKKEFGKLKVGFDSTMVVIGGASSFILLHTLAGVREGTVIAALLVGFIVKYYNSKIHFLDRWLGGEVSESAVDVALDACGESLVVTISREYGSGGHKIGRAVAERLGVPFYDRELIEMTAEQSGFTEEYIKENEQKLAGSLLDELYLQSYGYVKDELPPSDVLFLVQSKIIREICSKGPCVIVGRCANFVLKNNPHCFNVFIHANEQYRKLKIVEEYGVESAVSHSEMEKMDRYRANYCLQYTGKDWRDSTNYHVTLDSSLYDDQVIAGKLVDLLQGASVLP